MAVLRATLQLVEERPPGDITIKAIAREAGVGRQTIYRWWSQRGEIIMEALREIISRRIGPSTSSDIEAAVRQFVRETVTQAHTVRKALVVALIDAQMDETFLDAFKAEFIDVRRQALLQIIDQLDPDRSLSLPDQQFFADQIYGPLWYRLLIRHAPLNRAFADELAGAALEWRERRLTE